MIKALFKKQMLESFSWLYFSPKNGKRRDAKGITLFVLLYLFLFGMLGYIFYTLAVTLCEPLYLMGLGWLYFALAGLLSVVLGVFGSVFNTYASLYQPKDNDILLSMPIPASRILLMRLSGVYALGLLYELLVMIPALIAWFQFANIGTLGIIFSILIPFVISIFILTLSCILGWVVALVAGKVKNKSFITVLLSLAFIAVYYYLYFKAGSMLTGILENPYGLADNVKRILYPIYQMGLAAEGGVIPMLIFTAIIGAFFGIVYLVLTRSFFKLATTNKGTAVSTGKKWSVETGSIESALFKKELKRFTGSASYMMNCGLGILFMVAASVALLIKGETVAEILPLLYEGAGNIIPLILAATICTFISMNDITAPSVSLEGKNIRIVQVLPVTGWQVLKAKLKLHLSLTLPPTVLLTTCVLVVCKPAAEFTILISVIVLLFCFMMAFTGLWLNLKFPNLNWTTETVPIKQSMSVTLSLFGGWVIVIALGIIYYLLYDFVSALGFMVAVSALFLVLNLILYRWLKGKGSKIFEKL